jgi:GT2 family glycosyltransferase
MNFTLLIVTYNRLELLKECIKSALEQTYSLKHIVILNNNSNDGTTDYLCEIGSQHKHIIISNEVNNLGGAGGFQRGMEIASTLNSDWIILIDDDAMLSKNFVKDIFLASEQNPSIQALCGSVWTNGIIDVTHRRRLSGKIGLRFTDVQASEYENEEFNVDLSSFCGLCITTQLVKKIGLPLAEYFIWNDDAEYSLRVLKESMILCIPKAALNHKTKNSSITVIENELNWKHYYGLRNAINMVKRHGNFIDILYKYFELTISILYYCNYYIRNHNNSISSTNIYILAYALKDGALNHLGKNSKFSPK